MQTRRIPEQHRQIINQLDQIQGRLAKIEATLRSGLTVKVSEMPPVKIAEPSKRQ